MNKVAIVYWSGTGNTETMANCIADGVQQAGGEATLLTPDKFSPSRLPDFQVFAFGCPAMGCEVLEEVEFEPMFTAVESALAGQKVALFGSYGWGDGQWMRDWSARCAGADLYDQNGLTVNDAPDDAAQEACRNLGRELAAW
jgi:flavodoxin short chain